MAAGALLRGSGARFRPFCEQGASSRLFLLRYNHRQLLLDHIDVDKEALIPCFNAAFLQHGLDSMV